MEEGHSTKIHGIFDNLSESYEVNKFWKIRWCLDVRDIIIVNELPSYANGGLLMNF